MPGSPPWPAIICSRRIFAIQLPVGEKGQVEKNVQDAWRRLWQPMPNFPDIDALNVWLEHRCIEQ